MNTKLIRKRSFTSVRPHDSKQKDVLLSGDEKAVFGDSAYSNMDDKRQARKQGIFYGILDKCTRRKKHPIVKSKATRRRVRLEIK